MAEKHQKKKKGSALKILLAVLLLLVLTVGAAGGMNVLMKTLLNPGDEVLIPQPSFVSYLPCAVLADGVPVVINLKAENEFRLTTSSSDLRTSRTRSQNAPK